MLLKKILYYNLLTIFFALYISVTVAQNPIPASSLTSDDRKDLEELTNLMHKAEDFEASAKEIYEEIDKLKEEEGLTNDSEKIKKLRKKAIKEDIQAFDKRKEAHKIRYDLYQRHLEKFRESGDTSEMEAIKAKLLIEDADQFFYRASTLRNEAYNQTSELEKKFEKLEKANNIENLGLEKIEKALTAYYKKEEKQKSQTFSEELPTINNDKVVVNRKLLSNIRQTMSKVKNYTFRDQFQNIDERDTVDGKKLTELWYAYIYPEKEKLSSTVTRENSKEKTAISTQTEESFSEDTAKAEISQEQKEKAADEEIKESVKEADRDKQKSDKISDKEEFASGMIFKVQIAADKKPLSQSTLRKLYNGNKKEISRVVENGWYKYSIGDFKTFDQAEKFKDNLDTRDAFIVAYQNGKQVTPERSESKAVTDSKEAKTKTEEETVSGSAREVVFKVQIAAARNPMNNRLLNQRYNGPMEINKDKVGGWHKYSIGEFSNYEEANKQKKQADVEGAFVTAYKNGELLDIKHAIQLSEGKEPIQPSMERSREDLTGVTFKVQIAADRIQLDNNRLEEIYSGVKKIQLDKGDGWYRYSIGTCPTYFHAKQLRRKTDVRGAFVVAYKNGERLNAYKLRSSKVLCPNLDLTKYKGSSDNLVFSVQIAASSRSLNVDDLKFIYCGNRTIQEHKVGKWHKYTVGTFDNYEQAAELKKNICVPGAFVVAYEGTQQINIKEAINK